MTLAPEHSELNEHLNAYLDRAVDEPVRRRLTAHLTTCAACRSDLAQLRATRDAVRDLPPLRAPRPFTLPEPLGPRGTPVGPQPGARGDVARQGSLRQDPGALPRLGLAGGVLTWAWRLGGLAATLCLLISLTTFAVPAPQSVFTGAADSASRLSSAPTAPAPGPAPVPSESLARSAAPSGAASSGQPGVPAPALAERDSSQRVAPAAQADRPGAPQSPAREIAPGIPSAPAPDSPSGAQGQVAPPPASRAPSPDSEQSSAAQWLALAVVLALASAALFAFDRRAATRVDIR